MFCRPTTQARALSALRLSLCLAAALALLACADKQQPASGEPPPEQPAPPSPSAPETPPENPPENPEQPPEPPADDAETLSALTADHLSDVELTGELGCSFRADGSEDMLMVGKGNVARDQHSFAAVRYGGRTMKLESRELGGYDAMANGVGFVGEDLEIEVQRTQTEPLDDQVETVTYPARLVITPADGEARTIAGRWTCGP